MLQSVKITLFATAFVSDAGDHRMLSARDSTFPGSKEAGSLNAHILGARRVIWRVIPSIVVISGGERTHV